MTKIKDVSIYVVFSIAIFLVVFVIMMSSLYIENKKIQKDLLHSSNESAEHTISMLSLTIRDFVSSYAVHEYEKLLLAQMNKDDIIAIVVDDYILANIMGKEHYYSGKLRYNKEIVEFDKENQAHQKELSLALFHLAKPVLSYKNKKIAEISIYIGQEKLITTFQNAARTSIIKTIILTALLMATLFLVLNRYLIAPLIDIAKQLNILGKDGLPKVPITVNAAKEIHILSITMNKMIDTIKGSRKVLDKQKRVLHFQAFHDDLTKLGNRSYLENRLMSSIEMAKRDNRRLAVLFIDLDHFKEINDAYGHQIGDLLLIKVTSNLENIIRKEDTLSRQGGDEFIIVMESLENAEDTSLLANKILHTFKNTIHIDTHDIYIGCSIGISIFPDNGDNKDDLLKFADVAMYKAKAEGRNNFQFYSSVMTDLVIRRVEMEKNLHEAILNKEFSVYYQPQICLHEGRLNGFEALVRWNHPTLGVVSPGDFLPIAEDTGLLVAIDWIVIEKAMKTISLWHHNKMFIGKMAINLTLKQLHQKEFMSRIKHLLDKYKCQSSWIEFEVTENDIMTHPVESIKLLHEIKNIGFSIALDDFGTGYSSLSHLNQMPIDKLKIDQSFVQNLPNNKQDMTMVIGIIALAKSLGIRILAEGVETEDQQKFLIENGCMGLQGYLFSKPIQENSALKYIQSQVLIKSCDTDSSS
jgi:diguanylate cyclase (GGDEF)-like protein